MNCKVGGSPAGSKFDGCIQYVLGLYRIGAQNLESTLV